MRILLVCSGAAPLGFGLGSGAENFALALARLLRAKGHTLTIAAHEDSQLPPDEMLLGVAGELDAAQEEQPAHHELRVEPESCTYALWTTIRRRQTDWDLIVNLAYHWLPFYLEEFFHTPVAHSLLFSARLPAVDQLIAKSPSRLCVMTKSQAASFGLDSSRVAVTGFGLDLTRYSFQAKATGDAYLAWAGRIVADKGLEDAVAAAGQAGLPLKVAGSIRDHEYWTQVQAVANIYETKMEHLGRLTQEELGRMIGGALGFLMTPKWIEAFGIVVIESLAVGTPVIAFKRGGPADIVEDGVNGFRVEADDVDGLAAAIHRLPDISRARCRESAEQLWTEQVFADKMEEWMEGHLAKL